MAIKRYEKTPEGSLDYSIEWTDWLLGVDTIATSLWSISPDDAVLTFDLGQIDVPTGTTTGWFSGGTEGQTYTLTNTITTANVSNPRTTSRSFLLTILDTRYLESV